MKKLYGSFCKDIIIYGIGGILAKGLSLITLPIYTRIFSPSEYGCIETLFILNNLFGIVLTSGMDSAQSFYFSKQKAFSDTLGQKTTVSAIIQWRLCWGTLLIILGTLFSQYLNQNFFSNQFSANYFFISFLDAFLVQFTYQCADIFRLTYQPTRFFLIIFVHQIVAFLSVLLLVCYSSLGIYGYIVGMAVGGVFSATIGLMCIRDYLAFQLKDFMLWPKLLQFGVPLLPSGVALYVIQSADRWFILKYYGEEILGLYSAGAKLALAFTLGIEVFRKAWWPIALEAMHKPYGKLFIRNVANLYLSASIVLALLFGLSSPWIMKLLVPDYFQKSYYITAILCWQGVFWGFYLIGSIGLWKTENTLYLSGLTIAASALNVALDYFLVPKFGMLAAALGTVFVYFFWNFATLILSERIYRIGYNYFSIFRNLTIGCLASISILFYHKDIISASALILSVSLAILFLAYFTFKNFLGHEDVNEQYSST